MKTHLSRSLVAAHLTVAALLIAGASSLSAQTVITPDLKATPGSYNPASAGMVLRAHQINSVRSPGEQNSIPNVLKELSGGFGPSLSGATNGPLTGGLWSETYLNHAIDPSFPADYDTQWYFFGAPTLPFPGIVTNVAVSTFAYEIITYLNLPAGTNRLVVGSGDSFRLTIGAGDNPYDFTAVQPANGLFSGSRNYDTNLIVLDVQSAGVYPVRIIYGQGGGTAGLQFYSLFNIGSPEFPFYQFYLINDPNGFGSQLTAYQPASLPIVPSKAYISEVTPVPGETGVSPLPTVRVKLTDGSTTTVNTNAITLAFDGAPVSPTITQTGNVTYVSYTSPSPLAGLTAHTAQVVAQDSAANVLSNQWSFTVGAFTVISASYAYPAGSADATQPGFAGRIHQTRDAANGTPAIAYGNAQIEGQLIDSLTGQPYINTVVTNGNPIIGAGWTGTQPADAGGGPGDARTFTVTNVVNYSIADGSGGVMDTGNFNSINGYPDALFPGLPGGIDDAFTTYDNSGEIAVELVAFVELSAGLQQIGVNCNDGLQLAISPNDARDLFRQGLIQIDVNRDTQDSVSTVFVETNGLYSFRVIYRVYRDTVANSLEWFSADPDNPANRVLLNATVAGAKKAYRAVTVPTREYVKSVSPAQGASGVSPTAPINVVLVNLGTNVPVLKVNGATVAHTAVTNGNEVTLTYTPTAALSGTVDCEIAYGGLVGQWSYAIRSGRAALYITAGTGTAGDAALINRLATKFGLDVTVLDQGWPNNNPTNMTVFTNKVLLVIASPIGSGNTAAWLRNYMSNSIPVPVICWEFGNADELALTEGTAGGSGSGTQVVITNAPHYLNLMNTFTNGQVVTTFSASGGQTHVTTPAPGTIIAAQRTGGQPCIVGVTNGLVVNSSVYGGPITHASRKLHWGVVENTSATLLTDDGWKLFDAAIEWLLPSELTATKGPGAGQMGLSWTGEGTLQTTTTLTPPAWGNAPSQANPQTVNTTDLQRYYRVKQ
jgi:hypothetical protein